MNSRVTIDGAGTAQASRGSRVTIDGGVTSDAGREFQTVN